MKTNRLLLTLTLAAISLISIGCSNGGGDSTVVPTTPTVPDTVFSLATLQSDAVGTVYNTQLTGSDTNGVTYTGSLSMANRVEIMLNGVLVTPHEAIISLTGGGNSMTVTATSYTDTNNFLISVVVQTTGLVCTPVSPDTIPSSVKIGDFGILSTMVCDDNTTQERSWRVEDGGNGTAKLVSSGVIKDQFNTITTAVDVTHTINVAGDILAFKTVSKLLASNFTLTYQSI